MPDIAGSVESVRFRIAEAERRSGGSAGTVTLLAVSKRVPAERVVAAYNAGVRAFGENYIQEALDKIETVRPEAPEAHWHYIGHLQTNKSKEVVGRFALVHGVDSVRLARSIGKRAVNEQVDVNILLEVKLDRAEPAKTGFLEEELDRVVGEITEIRGARMCGLMGIAPFAEDPEAARPHFRRLRGMFDRLPPASRQILSMGMSGDFEVAIEEGSTLVRIGTAIFGKRD